jgi:hypothetical protein
LATAAHGISQVFSKWAITASKQASKQASKHMSAFTASQHTTLQSSFAGQLNASATDHALLSKKEMHSSTAHKSAPVGACHLSSQAPGRRSTAYHAMHSLLL